VLDPEGPTERVVTQVRTVALALEEGISTTVAQVLLDGRVLCHGTDTRSWVEWTDARLGVYAIAYGRDGDRLVDWWRSSAGPYG
jgi:hypothetical protein